MKSPVRALFNALVIGTGLLLGVNCSSNAPARPSAQGVASGQAHGERRDAHRQLLQACRSDDGAACLELAEVLLDARPESDGVLMTEVAARGCELGQANACAIAGAGWIFGGAGRIDRDKAASYFERACAGGSPIGCSSWSQAVMEGWGRPFDPKPSLARVAATCELERDLLSCSAEVVLRLLETHNAEIDVRSANRLKEYCDAGYGASCAYLAGLYRSGRGVPADLTRASSLCQEAEAREREDAVQGNRAFKRSPCPRDIEKP